MTPISQNEFAASSKRPKSLVGEGRLIDAKHLRRCGTGPQVANLGLVPNVRNMFGVLLC